MDSKFLIFLSLLFIYGCVAPPVTKNKEEQHEEPDSDGLENYMEYHRYLREVVNALESDADFKKKLEKASEDDIKSGKIAHELEFVNHHVRTQLDEIKRMELERLRELTEKKNELLENNSIDDPTHHHLDNTNPHTFEIQDLKKLIAKTTEDLAEADRKRREEFKQYELQKEYDKQEKLNHTAGDERTKLEKEIKEQEEKHKNHDRLHEPGHKQQLEEVWEEQDHMQQDFDPKTFFMLHDLDSNGLWDQTEVKALFIKELDKMYSAGAPEDDMRERAEEMERMRESVFREVDTNRDGFIDYTEFLAQTKRNEYQQDHGWQGIDEQKPFTDEEFDEYIRQYRLHPFFGYAIHDIAEAQQQAYPQHMPPPGMAHPGQVPPGYYPPHGNEIPHGGAYYPSQNAGGPQHPQAAQMPPQQQQYINSQQQMHNDDQRYRQEQMQKFAPQPNQGQHQQQQYMQQQQQNAQYQQQNIQHQQPNVQHQQPNMQHQQPNMQPPQQQNIQYQQNNQPQQQNIQAQQQNNQPQPNIQSQQNIQPQQPNIQPQQANIQPQQPNIQPQVLQNQQNNMQQQQQHPNEIHNNPANTNNVNNQGIKHK